LKYESDHRALDILNQATTALKRDFFLKEFDFNRLPISSQIEAEKSWQVQPREFDLSKQPPEPEKQFALIEEIRSKLPQLPESILSDPNDPALDQFQYRNYKPLVVESVILQYAHWMNSDHEVAECVGRIKHGLRKLDPFRYIYYQSLQLSNLFKRVYHKHRQNHPIAIIVLKLHFSGFDDFILDASKALIGNNQRDRWSFITAPVNAERIPLEVFRIGQEDITQDENAVRSVLADVSRGLELFKTKYANQGIANYFIWTRNYLEQQRDHIPQVDIVSLYPRVTWGPDSQKAFQDLMNRVLGVASSFSV
jgi:hypothetical protein